MILTFISTSLLVSLGATTLCHHPIHPGRHFLNRGNCTWQQLAELMVHASSSKQDKLHSITPTQWSAANLAIMAKLIQNGKIGDTGTTQYLKYTYKIGNLGIHLGPHFAIWVWVSPTAIPLGCSWGTDIYHLRTTALVPKQLVAPSSMKHGKDQRPITTPDSRNICRYYNGSFCLCNLCRYAYCCSVSGCLGDQPATSHDTSCSTTETKK